MRRVSFAGAAAAICIAVVLLASACSKHGPRVYRKDKILMDTVVSLTVVADADAAAERAIDATFKLIGDFGERINFFSETSELSAINRNAGVKPVKVSADTLGVIERAVYIADLSGGTYDPTIGPEMRLWDFQAKKRPADAEIARLLPLVNYRDIIIDRTQSTVFLKRKGMLMDLGGIAKGYAADRALETLKQNGITAGVVATAGDIRVFGLKPDGKPWNVGVRNPRRQGDSDEILATMRLSDKAVSTSGDYERFFIEGEKRYHHILDPKTGLPAGLCRSVTVVSSKGIFADGFSTAVFVLGPVKGMELARSQGVDAVIVDSAGEIHVSPGLREVMTLENRR